METNKDIYCYSALLTNQPNFDDFPHKRWQELLDGIEKRYYELRISDIASNLNLYWPKSGYFISLTISESLYPSLPELLNAKSMGKKKALTILLALTYIYENPENIEEKPNTYELSPKELLTKNPDKWASIIAQKWKLIQQLIPKNYHIKKIYELANDMGLKWPDRNWDTWTVNDCLRHSFDSLARTKGMGKKKLETIARILINLSAPIDQQVVKPTSSSTLWNHPVIENLTDRKREIFERRLLTVYEKPTLEELGAQYKVTRERIRQLERDIKKSIHASGLRKYLKELLDNYIKSELLPHYSERLYLLKHEVPSMVATLDSELVLSIALSYKSIYEMLSNIGVETSCGWYFGKRSEFKAITKSLENEICCLLPAPTQHLSAKLKVRPDKLVAVCLLNQIAVPEGVLLLPHKTGRADANRAARCYNKALLNNCRFWRIDDLIEDTAGPLSPQQQRLYKIAINRAPRLFISTSSYVAQLDHSVQPRASIYDSQIALDVDNADPDDEYSNSNMKILRELLSNEWPITSTNILEYSKQPPYQTDLATNSLIIAVNSMPGCTRLAPGIYGPKDYMDHPEKFKKARKLTMSESDIVSYCLARRSGESCEEIFPLWDAHQEQLWFRKLCKKSEDNPLLLSFISIARQDKWPEQLQTESLKLMEYAVSAKFMLEPKWINARSYNVPDLGITLTVLRYAKDVGPLSWIRANHISCTYRLTEELGVSVLICGLALGLLDTNKRAWWKPFPASNNFDANWERIQSLFLEKDIPDWNHPVIQEYFESARKLANNKNLGFVRGDSLDSFIYTLQSKTE